MNESHVTASSIRSKRIFYLAFATITLLVLGLIYAWTILSGPIVAEFPDYKGVASQVFQVSMFAFCVSALFGAQIIKRASAKAAILVAAALFGAGFVLTALTASLGVWALFAFYGIIGASGCGIAYNAIISLVNPWFPDKIGLCSGVQMMGFGVSALALGLLCETAFNTEGIWWGMVFIVIALVGVLAMLALAFIVKPAPAGIAATLGMQGAAATVKESPTKNQSIMSTKVFWLYSIWATFVIACGLALIGSVKPGATAIGAEAGFAAVLVGLVSTMNGLGRIINGTLFDKFGLVPVMMISASTAIVTMVCLALSVGMAVLPLYVVAAILVASPYGSVPVMASAYARQRYKAADFAKNLGIANCNIASAALINIIISGILGSPAAGQGPVIYGILAVLAAIALLVVFLFSKVYKSDLAQIAKELE
ncbi:MAG: MFS transporter [Coriobacteriaceae bacterium]|nr:MFS transporter [Coriobacteriaceae bacterium]